MRSGAGSSRPAAIVGTSPSGARYDLCIVGAGIAGLNALAVAARYLTSGQRVALIDRRPEVGGRWVDTYDHLRGAPSSSLLTAGHFDRAFAWQRGDLATKAHVLDHLRRCVEVVQRDLVVDEFLGWECERVEEVDGQLLITCRSDDGSRNVLRADRLINAFGFDVEPEEPLVVAGSRLRSVAPGDFDLRGPDMRDSRAPVWLVGGGNTALGTAYTLLTAYPGREVNLVTGPGTSYPLRDGALGVRRRRHRGRPNSLMAELADRFDGTNEDDLQAWGQVELGVSLTSASNSGRADMLAEASEVIRGGLNEVVLDHFVDVVGRRRSARMTLRSGATRAIPADSWIVNCTGHLPRHMRGYEPYVNSSGSVVTVNTRSAVLPLSSIAGYFLSTLLLLDKIRDVPLYALDADDLLRKSKTAFLPTLVTLSRYNLGLIVDRVPKGVFDAAAGLDLQRWYPVPHRFVGQLPLARNHHGDLEHHRQTLDTIMSRFEVHGGTLV